MTAVQIFPLANYFALAGWAILIAGIIWNRPWLRETLAGTWWPILLSAGYLVTIVLGLSGGSGGNFSSLAGVRQLFANDWVLLAGWIHYLAFDLFVGAWIAGEAERKGLSRWLLVPILPLTFLFGPVGYLLFHICGGTFGQRRSA
jgi:hypothetical protein